MSALYSLEPLLLAHVRAHCPSVQFVAGVADPAAVRANYQFVNERPQPLTNAAGAGSARYGGVFVCPAADFNGIETAATTTEGACEIVRQRWLLLVATKGSPKVNQADNDQPYAARVDNGVLVGEVTAAMHAFRWAPAGWANARARLNLNRVATGLPANTFADENGLYLTALAYQTEHPD